MNRTMQNLVPVVAAILFEAKVNPVRWNRPTAIRALAGRTDTKMLLKTLIEFEQEVKECLLSVEDVVIDIDN